MATKTLRLVKQARVKRAQQAARVKAMLARGKVSNAQTITITKARMKARLLVRKELDKKVAATAALNQALRIFYEANKNRLEWDATSSTSLPSELALVAAIPDLPTPAPSRPGSPASSDDFDFSSPPATRSPSPPPPPPAKKRRRHADYKMVHGIED